MDANMAAITIPAIAMAMVVAVIFITKGLPLVLAHQREWAQTRRGANSGTDELRDRVAALGQRCTKLEEQITEAHVLLADEQRQMDKKLAAILPDAPSPEYGNPETKDRGAQRQPVR